MTFLLSCEKDESKVNAICNSDCVTIKGVLTTSENAADIVPNARMELSWSRPATPLGDPGRLIATQTTGELGGFEFVFAPKEKELKDGKFYIDIFPPDESYYNRTVSFYDIEKSDTVVNQNIHLPSKASIEIILPNLNEGDSTDSYHVSAYFNMYGYGDPNRHVTSSFVDEQGNDLYTAFEFKKDSEFSGQSLFGITAGNQYTMVRAILIKSGERTEKTDSVFIPQGETGVLELEF